MADVTITTLHRTGKQISFSLTSTIPLYVFQIWAFFDLHPDCIHADVEDVQKEPSMYFRKAALLKALHLGRPEKGMEDIVYPTEQVCVEHALSILRNQKRFQNVFVIDIQELQNEVAIPYRKSITRQALCILKQENDTKLLQESKSENHTTANSNNIDVITDNIVNDTSKPRSRTQKRRARRKYAKACEKEKERTQAKSTVTIHWIGTLESKDFE